MTEFGILHLTDLHYGQARQEDLLPNVRQRFFEDLEKLHKYSGPWDLVAFTGDLVFKGDPDEFKRLEDLLSQLWTHLKGLGSQPILLAVPGNHDLKRPDEIRAEVMVLRDLATTSSFEPVWNEMFAKASPYRYVLDEAFAAFTAWWDTCPLRGQDRKDFRYQPGPLPGDFSAILEKETVRLGIVGLNSTFLQLTGGDYEGKLAVRARQFNGACGGDGEAWVREVDACILLTHQPPSWLAKESRTSFDELIDKPGRFAAHYCGHLHLQDSESRGRGWSPLRRLVQGGSLFGLETLPGGTERIHAYGASRIILDGPGPEGRIRHWPRLATRQLSGELNFSRDGNFALEEADGGTRPEQFSRLRAVKSPPLPLDRAKPDGPQPVAPKTPPWPAIPPRPVLDPEALFRRHFIGREDLLFDYEDALEGLDFRSRGAATQGRSGAVQLVWLHGFGGMGKSWFLRRACVKAEALGRPPKVALIDWHLPEWHKPAAMPPTDPRELFEAIAYRLAQLYGIERLESYWRARDQVDQCWPKHQQLHDKLDEAITLIQIHGPGWRTVQVPGGPSLALSGETAAQLRHLERLLRDRGLWSDDAIALNRRLDDLRRHLLRFDAPDDGSQGGLFEAWAQEIAGAENECVARPCRHLAETLQTCLRSLCSEAHLVLVLDTCEVLPSPMEGWLRRLLAPPLDGMTPILVLIGSRRRPDVEVGPGQRGGWRDEVESVRFRLVPFDEGVRFTVSDLAQALVLENRPVPAGAELPAILHRITLGIPLALGVLLGMHRDGDPVLDELAALDRGAADDLVEDRAVQTVIGVVAGRFLVHLEDRPQAVDDLRDVTALALLRRANTEVLSAFWNTSWPIQRLRALAQKYALLAAGDLHSVVREILRRHWRQAPPGYLDAIAGDLFNAVGKVQPEAPLPDSTRMDWDLERLNLLSWLRGEDVYPELARSLVVFLAFELDSKEILNIAQEIHPVREQARKAKEMLDSEHWWFWQPWSNEALVTWLEQQRSSAWSAQERACLDLLVGMSLSGRKQHDHAIVRLERAFEVLALNLPRRDAVAHVYLNSIRSLDQSETALAEKGYQWASRLGLVDPEIWNLDYYWVLHNARRYAEAESYCQGCIEHDPSNQVAYACLGHILGVHLDRQQEAEVEFRRGIEINENEPNLHFFLGEMLEKKLGRFEEAEAEYRKTLDLAQPHDRTNVLMQLGRLLKDKLKRHEEATAIWQKIVLLEPTDTNILNTVAWNLYKDHIQLDDAENMASRALKNEPDNEHVLHTLAAILVRRHKWAEAKPKVQGWLRKVAAGDFKRAWHDFQPLFYDAIRDGHAKELRTILNHRQDDPVWTLLRSAVEAVSSDSTDFSSLPAAARKLKEQLLSEGVQHVFPG